jgi:hypothetical protein
LLHYTVVPLQPWRSDDNPHGRLWELAFRDAVRAGAVPWDEVEELVQSGEVKRSLVDAFDEADADAGATPSTDPVAVELHAVREQLADVHLRSFRGRVRRGAKATWPLVRRVRDRWPGSPIASCADQMHDLARAKL